MSEPPDLIGDLQRCMGDGGGKLFDVVPALLRAVLEDRLWEQHPDRKGVPFASFEAFVTHKLWWGLESTIDDLLMYCRAAPDVQALIRAEVGAAGKHGGARDQVEQGSNTTLGDDDDRGATYVLRRLKRDNPELAEQVVAGVLSAHAAAVQSGIRRATWTAPSDPARLAQAIERKFPGWRLVRVCE